MFKAIHALKVPIMPMAFADILLNKASHAFLGEDMY